MNFILKGVTKSKTVQDLSLSSLEQFSFDLRPRSFNFTQLENIKNIVKQNSQVKKFSLMFDSAPEHMYTELHKKVTEVANEDQEIFLEFVEPSLLSKNESLKIPYIWHYHPEEKIKSIENTEYLQRIVFHHRDLEEYNARGELHGFFNLFQEYTHKIYFEIQLDWDTELIISLFDFFEIPMLSFEINNKVELSYQNPDHTLVKKNLTNLNSLFTDK